MIAAVTTLLTKVLGASFSTSLAGLLVIVCGCLMLVGAALHADFREVLAINGGALITAGIGLVKARAENTTSEEQRQNPGLLSTAKDPPAGRP